MSILFLIRFNGTMIQTFETRHAALFAFEVHKRDSRYTLHAATPQTRRVEGAERWLEEKDRARGKSAHLKGRRSKEWRGESVVIGVVETRIA